MDQVKAMFFKGAFFFTIGVVLATLFVWSMVQGVMSHLTGGDYALFYYFASWLAGIGGLTLYLQAKQILHYATISK
jgi:hypothetical protein